MTAPIGVSIGTFTVTKRLYRQLGPLANGLRRAGSVSDRRKSAAVTVTKRLFSMDRTVTKRFFLWFRPLPNGCIGECGYYEPGLAVSECKSRIRETVSRLERTMKKDIHPKYEEANVT